MKKLIKVLAPLKTFSAGLNERALPVYATSGCYYLFMSLVPFVMILCCLLPYTPFNQQLVLDYVDKYFSSQLGNVLRTIVNAVYRSNSATLTISILLTVYSASASMRSLMKGMNAAYGFMNTDGFIKMNIKALLFLVMMVAAILTSLVILVYGASIVRLISRYIPYSTALAPLRSGMRYVTIMGILSVFFLLLYNLMPAKKVMFRFQIPGAIFSAVLWVSFSAVFSWYVEISDKFGAYGFIGTIMVVMMWMNYCLYILLIGGYINSWFENRHKCKLSAATSD